MCEWCGRQGPKSRLAEHIRLDHPELAERNTATPWNAPGFHVNIPIRFRPILMAIQAQTGRSLGQIIAAALDAQGLGRTERPQ